MSFEGRLVSTTVGIRVQGSAFTLPETDMSDSEYYCIVDGHYQLAVNYKGIQDTRSLQLVSLAGFVFYGFNMG